MKSAFSKPQNPLTGPGLIAARVTVGSMLADKIFLIGQVDVDSDDHITIHVNDDMPTAILRNEFRVSSGLNVPLIQEIMDGGAVDKRSRILLSAGAFLRFGEHLALLRRDGNTAYKPYHLNQPIGRAQTYTGLTAIKELNEELHVFVKDGQQLVPLIFSFNDTTGISIKEKFKHLRILADHHQAATGNKLKIADKVHDISTGVYTPDQIYAHDVSFCVNGTTREKSCMIPVYAPDLHTFELNFSLQVPAAFEDPDRIVLMSGEPVGRESSLHTLDNIENDKLSASLAAYCAMKKAGHNPQLARFKAFSQAPA